MSTIYNIFKKMAFQFDPELAHSVSLYSFKKMPWLASFWNFLEEPSKYSINVNGNTWTFPVGLAAGVDENGCAIDFFTRLNFGAVEVGTITPKFQIGNEKPRLWRYPEEESLRNRMGFNNLGSELAFPGIVNSKRNAKVLGINIGKNKTTPQENAVDDYLFLYNKFAQYVDYLVINISSPNTPGLRDLLAKDSLENILAGLENARRENSKPLYLKISPDQNFDDLGETIEVAKKFGLAGIVATNTTIIKSKGPGGVSGQLLREKSRKVRAFVQERINEVDHMHLIAVGGISTFDDLWEHWKQGGRAAQIYSSFIFKGPGILFEFKKEIDRILKLNQVESLQELLDNIHDAVK